MFAMRTILSVNVDIVFTLCDKLDKNDVRDHYSIDNKSSD